MKETVSLFKEGHKNGNDAEQSIKNIRNHSNKFMNGKTHGQNISILRFNFCIYVEINV